MATPEELAAAISILQGGNQEVAAQNPYARFGGVADQIAPLFIQGGTSGKLSVGQSIGGALASGLVSGIIGGAAQDYQAQKEAAYADTLAKLFRDPQAENTGELSDSLFRSAQNKASLFKLQGEMQRAQEQQDLEREVTKAGLIEQSKIMGQNAAYASDGGENPTSPVFKAKREIEDKTYNRITSLPEYKLLSDLDSNVRSLPDVVNQDSRPADLALFSTIARIRDPNSVVREGEVTMNADAQALLDSVYGDWRSVVNGKSRLNPETKALIVESVIPKYNELAKAYGTNRTKLIAALKQQGGDESRVPTPEFSLLGDEFRSRLKGTSLGNVAQGSANPLASISSEQIRAAIAQKQQNLRAPQAQPTNTMIKGYAQ